MNVVALISGGKDSCHNMSQCVAEGHTIVALANLRPKDKDELDSYMYQSVGHHAIELYAEAMDLPLFRRTITGTSQVTGRDYTVTPDDEVEDLYELLKTVKQEVGVEAVSVGAILSNYQRVRVENVCSRLGLTLLAYLWRRDQAELLDEMIACGVDAILIKVAAMGLKPEKHLGKSLAEMRDYLHKMQGEFDLNVCGEGGEYETFTLDCPLFKKRIVIDEVERVSHSDDAFAPVGYLNIRRAHLEGKHTAVAASQQQRVAHLEMQRSSSLVHELFPDGEPLGCRTCERLQTYPSVRDGLSPNIEARLHQRGDHLWVSGLPVQYQPGCDVQTLVHRAISRLRDMVTGCGPGWDMSCLSLVHLYVNKMEDFAAINTVYKTFFGANPAARVCVQAPLPENVAMQLDCYGYSCHDNRDTMHVQGLSHWAPANIGPYSQAVKIEDRVYVAGQIGMVPANLSIVAGGVRAECRLSLRHVHRVLAAMCPSVSAGSVLSCVCYVTDPSYISTAEDEWGRARSSHNEVPCRVMYVVVPQLPKSALVEWQVVAVCDAVGQIRNHERHDVTGNLECDVTFYCGMVGQDTDMAASNVFLSCTGYITCLTDTTAQETLSVLNKTYTRVVQDSKTRQSNMPLMRIFYSAGHFQYNQLYEALVSMCPDLPFSLVPVLQLGKPGVILGFCQ